MAETITRFDDQALKFEYGLDGIRLLPWAGLNAPFGGAFRAWSGGHAPAFGALSVPRDRSQVEPGAGPSDADDDLPI